LDLSSAKNCASAISGPIPSFAAWVCVDMLFSTPLMLAALFIAGWNTTTCFVVVFFGQVLLNLNWAIVADILLVCDYCHCSSVRLVVGYCYFSAYV
jgi:hypothetical protein